MESIWEWIKRLFRRSNFKENFEEYNLQKKVICDFIKKYDEDLSKSDIIDDKERKDILKLNKNRFDICSYLQDYEKKLTDEDIGITDHFVDIYSNFDKIIEKHNLKLRLSDEFDINEKSILSFIDDYGLNKFPNIFIEDFQCILVEKKFLFKLCNEIKDVWGNDFKSNNIIEDFIEIYNDFENISTKNNESYLKNLLNSFKDRKSKISDALKKYGQLDCETYLKNKDSFFDEFGEIHDVATELSCHNDNGDINIDLDILELINDFLELYNQFDGDFVKSYFDKYLGIKNKIFEFKEKFIDDACKCYIFNKNEPIEEYSSEMEIAQDILNLHQHDEVELNDNEDDCLTNVTVTFNDFDNVAEKNNKCYIQKLMNKFSDNKNEFSNFVNTFIEDALFDNFVDDIEKENIIEKNMENYDLACEMTSIPEIQKIDLISEFINVYDNFDEIIFKINQNYVSKLFDDNEKIIRKYVDILYERQDFYISNSIMKELKERYDSVFSNVNDLREYHKKSYHVGDIELLNNFPELEEVVVKKDSANEAFINRELSDNETYFDEMFKDQDIILDPQQRRAVVIDEDTTQIIAGAGTGKTLTLQAKIKYLIEKKGLLPSEIIAISYSNASVDDLKDRIPEEIDIKTIHSLANHILQENLEEPNVKAHALDEVIETYFIENVLDDKDKLKRIVDYYSYFKYPYEEYEEMDSIGELYDKESGMILEPLRSKYSSDYVTYGRNYVRSFEELMIANFLFINGINYQYESSYAPKTEEYRQIYDFLCDSLHIPIIELHNLTKSIINDLQIDEDMEIFETKKKRYKPDFYLPDYDIYIEHFGVNREGKAIWLKDPYEINKYSDSMKWKRDIHNKYHTKLLETYSYYRSENTLLENLEKILKNEGVIFNPRDIKEIYERIMIHENLNYLTDLILLIKSFISHFKGNDYDYSYMDVIERQIEKNAFEFNRVREQILFGIIHDIFDLYNEYLSDEFIDFDDMINDACKSITEKGCPINYRYILVDEYQDVSYMRFHLLKTIQEAIYSKIIVIGDDWQSIYKFSGCDVNLFKNLDEYYENPASVKIENTYRNSQQLIDVSGNFVMKNEYQIKKQLISPKSNSKPINISYFNIDDYEVRSFENLVNDIINSDDYDGSEILVLGRNRKDICRLVKKGMYADKIFTYHGKLDVLFEKNKYVPLIYLENKDIDIKYRTIHGSKGLQARYVIVINLKNKINGFPNKMQDDPILRFVVWQNDEDFKFAEERRLFYVALTRTKENCYLLVPQADQSEFIVELEKNREYINHIHHDFIDEISNQEDSQDKYISITTALKCPECKTGNVKLLWHEEDSNKRFFACSHMRCDWLGGSFKGELEDLKHLFSCPDCSGVVVKRNGVYGEFFSCNDYDCGFTCDDFSNSNYEKIELDMECRECGSKLLAAYDEVSNRGGFICSNDECNYYGGKFFMNPDNLEIYGYCPKCSGIIIKKSGRNGDFIGCSNYRKNGGCRFSDNLNNARRFLK